MLLLPSVATLVLLSVDGLITGQMAAQRLVNYGLLPAG